MIQLERHGQELIGDGSATPGRTGIDAAGALVGLVILLVGLPSRLAVAQLGGEATPAVLLGLALLLWVAVTRLTPGLGVARGRQPVRIALGLMALSLVASYAAGVLMHISGVSARGADRSMIYFAGLCGIALLAADGISSRQRLDRVLKTLVAMMAISAGLGILSFFFGWYPIDRIHIPGLSSSSPLTFIGQRNGFRRVTGTAQHPLEFGLLLALVLPIALHFALTTPRPRRLRWWVATVLIAAAVPMALSRAGIIGVFVVAALLFPTWPRRRQIISVALIPVYVLVMHFAVHGLFKTLTSLFTSATDDASITHRTYNYQRVGSVMHHHWLLGTGGFGSYDPVRFDNVLDNAYLSHLFETGVIGLACLFGLLWVGVYTARGARRRSVRVEDRSLAQSLAAAIAVAIPALFTFDALGYPMATGVLFLLIGCAGAAWRLARQEQLDALSALPTAPRAPATATVA